jgi:hypothetical protein
MRVVVSPITELIGVYDADSTIWGEMSYWIGARIGRRHCSLCDITHGTFTKKKDWTQCVSSLDVPFTTFHRNDAPRDVIAAAQEHFPIVLARRDGNLEVVLSDDELRSFNGSVGRMSEFLQTLL